MHVTLYCGTTFHLLAMAENEALFLIPCNLLEGFKSCISHGKCFNWAYWTYIPSQAQVATLSITVN